MIQKGDLTNKGIVKMIDNPWKNQDGTDADVLAVTDQGPFRISELTKIEKAERPPVPPLKSHVEFGSVMGMDLRPGQVFFAERVPKTDKLIHLKINTNLGEKNVVTNLGGSFEPSDFLNKTFMFVMNLAPMKMKGIDSEAMIMAATTSTYDSKDNSYKDKSVLMEIKLTIDSIIL